MQTFLFGEATESDFFSWHNLNNTYVESSKPSSHFPTLTSLKTRVDTGYLVGFSSNTSSQEVKNMWYPSNQSKNRISKMLDILKGRDHEDFHQDILSASYKCIEKNSVYPLIDVLEEWDATAEIMLDDELTKDIQEAKEEFKRGEGIQWEPMD